MDTSARPTDQTAANRLGAWVSSVGLDDHPDDVRRIATRCLVDLMAVGTAGAAEAVAGMAREMALAEHGSGPARVFGGAATTATGAAFANAVAGHALDFDDTCYAGITHGSVIVGPAVLAAADIVDASGAALLNGFICGSECAYGLGKATGNGIYFAGWWSTSVYGAIGAAAGAARVLELDAVATANAIALAALGTGGTIAGLGTDAKPLTAGTAAAAGMRAALLARAGASAPLGIFEDRRGFAQLFSAGRFDTAALDALGRVYALIDPGIFIKPFPSCTATHAALEATRQIMVEHDLSGTDVKQVVCAVPELVRISLVYDDPATPQEAQFSMPYAIASMVARGDFGVAALDPGNLRAPDIRALMARVAMREDADLTARATTGDIGPECARVEVETSDGRRLEAFASLATGAPENPMSDALLDGKFHALARHAGLGDKSEAWLARIHACERQDRAASLWP